MEFSAKGKMQWNILVFSHNILRLFSWNSPLAPLPPSPAPSPPTPPSLCRRRRQLSPGEARAKPGRRRRRRPSFSHAQENGSGPSLSLAAVLLGRLRSSTAGWRWCCGVGAAGHHGRGGSRRLPQCKFWAPRAPDGLRRDQMGFGGLRRLCSPAPPGGGGDGLASTRDGGVARVLY
jgi:hypothetical protein